jgi:hypothetical protein
MAENKQFKIDIPESIEGYKVTLFWGLTIKQIVLVFIATLFVGFSIFSLVARNFLNALGLLLVAVLALIGIAEIRGRNVYRYLLFIAAYYKTKPRVLIYHHYAVSAVQAAEAKHLVYEKESNTKLLIIIGIALILGLLLLLLIGFYLFHVIHT